MLEGDTDSFDFTTSLTREHSGVKTANRPQSTVRGGSTPGGSENTPVGRRPDDGEGTDAHIKEQEG